MNASDLDTKIEIKRLTTSADGFGGFTDTTSTIATVWAYKRELSGDITQTNGKRQKRVDLELIMRKNTASLIQDSDLLKIQDKDGEYTITNIFESDHKYFTSIKVTKVA